MKLNRSVLPPSEPQVDAVAQDVSHVRLSILFLAALSTVSVLAAGSWARDILAEQGKTRVELAQARQENVRLWSRSIERISACAAVGGVRGVTDDGETITVDMTAVDRALHVHRGGFGNDFTIREPDRSQGTAANRFTIGDARVGVVPPDGGAPGILSITGSSTLTLTGTTSSSGGATSLLSGDGTLARPYATALSRPAAPFFSAHAAWALPMPVLGEGRK